ncbi:hypothetical protein NMY22_g16758 [Coprinellus aureogranulatus]|nr:hypothetical protein NMY22_g16758 [Coprinellus aureogranulatus]
MLHNGGKENGPNSSASTLGRRNRNECEEEGNLSSGPRKRPSRQDPLVHHGRHFGRTVHAFCRPLPLLTDGLSRQLQVQAGVFGFVMLTTGQRPTREQIEHDIFARLMKINPSLEARVLKASEEELHYIADMINKGSSCARSDDTRSLKSAIIDWITPPGGTLSPPLSRNVKTDRGFYHYATGELLCPATLDWQDEEIRKELRSGEIAVSGDLWPIFLYLEHRLNPDNPWEGLFQGRLLVCAFKHVFTSPSSVENEARATRSGNAELHGMKSVTIASIAYIATLVRFALSSSAVFSRNDKSTDSERFYRSILHFLQSPSEAEEVGELIKWWNKKIFPSYHAESGDAVGSRSILLVQDLAKQWRATRTPLRNSPGNGARGSASVSP